MRVLPATAAAITILGACFAMSAPAQRSDVGPVIDALYVKECGACHVAFPPGLLPERSWRRLMEGLANHFNDDAELKPAEREQVTAYLAANAADRGMSIRSRDIMASIRDGDVPIRVTKIPYIEGLHGGLLDPAFKGRPSVKTLSECAACHPSAAQGRFGERRFVKTDEEFRLTRPR